MAKKQLVGEKDRSNVRRETGQKTKECPCRGKEEPLKGKGRKEGEEEILEGRKEGRKEKRDWREGRKERKEKRDWGERRGRETGGNEGR